MYRGVKLTNEHSSDFTIDKRAKMIEDLFTLVEERLADTPFIKNSNVFNFYRWPVLQKQTRDL